MSRQKCPECGEISQQYFRIKTGETVCRKCGCVWKVEQKKNSREAN